MKFSQSTTSLWMRFSAIFLGMAVLFWLPYENSSENVALLFAILICTWLVANDLVRSKHQAPRSINHTILAGFLAGAAVTPLTLALMVFKIGVHAHPVPDFSYDQIMSVIWRTPIWIIGGFFITLGAGILFTYQQTLQENLHAAER